MHSVSVTQRGQLSDVQVGELNVAMRSWQWSLDTQDSVRETVVRMVEASSYREVSRLTGFSTNTLQRWVREAKS